MKKIVVKLAIEDDNRKKKVLRIVAGVDGVDSVTVDVKENKITVIGAADPVFLTSKLRKFGNTELLSVGPAKEEKKDPPKQEPKKEEKKPEPPTVVYLPSYSPRPSEYSVVGDEYSYCTIC